jgi:ethanolamine utilization cobalamin adenosyltransferase
MTSLRGNTLVPKDHPVIALRGRIDSLEATILLAQVEFRRLGQEAAVADLGDVLDAVKAVMRAEVMAAPLPPLTLLGLDADQVRDRSHHPRLYAGIDHFAPSVDDGWAVVTLNALRTEAREAELAAYRAFKRPDGPHSTRPDILQTMNRLSSALYLMMFKAKTGQYDA